MIAGIKGIKKEETMTRVMLAITFIALALLAGYKLGHKASQDIQARQSDTAYIEQYLEAHGQ